MTWSGTPSAIAMTAEAAPDPRGSVRVSVAAPAGETVTVADAAGLLDSVHITKLGGTLVTPVAAGTLVAAVRGATDSLRSDAPRPAALGSVLVIGGAGWEGKFAAAALAERGWRVITDFGVAPKIAVTGGAPPALDTARLAAVVVLDSAAATQLGKGLVRYARSGGGVVFAGDAARSRDVAAIVPGTLMPRTRPPVLPADSIGPGATGFYTVALTGDAIALERRPEGVAVAARRVGAGRAIEVGYDDSWRWRMAGGAGGASTHRAWWSQVVGSVAYVGSSGDGMATSAAPLAALVDRIGPARPAPARATRWSIDPRVLLMLILGLLLIEWASRRLRGLK
jgi:hypothetical protein